MESVRFVRGEKAGNGKAAEPVQSFPKEVEPAVGGNGTTPPPPPEVSATAPEPPPKKPSLAITAAAMRMDPNIETTGVKRLLTRVAVIMKPDPQWWVQVCDNPEFRTDTLGVLEYNKDRRLYIVSPRYREILKSHYKLYYAFMGVSSGGAVFIWLVRMPDEDGSWNAWHASKYGAVTAAMNGGWVQVSSGQGGYDVKLPNRTMSPKPVWSEVIHPYTTFDEVLNLAFQGTFINVDDHPVITGLTVA